jgi:hypothetical protein
VAAFLVGAGEFERLLGVVARLCQATGQQQAFPQRGDHQFSDLDGFHQTLDRDGSQRLHLDAA